jgi:hypothetical protein
MTDVWAAKAISLGTGRIDVKGTKLLLLLLDMDIARNPIDIFGALAAVRSLSYGYTIDFHYGLCPSITTTNPWGRKEVNVKKTNCRQ